MVLFLFLSYSHEKRIIMHSSHLQMQELPLSQNSESKAKSELSTLTKLNETKHIETEIQMCEHINQATPTHNDKISNGEQVAQLWRQIFHNQQQSRILNWLNYMPAPLIKKLLYANNLIGILMFLTALFLLIACLLFTIIYMIDDNINIMFLSLGWLATTLFFIIFWITNIIIEENSSLKVVITKHTNEFIFKQELQTFVKYAFGINEMDEEDKFFYLSPKFLERYSYATPSQLKIVLDLLNTEQKLRSNGIREGTIRKNLQADWFQLLTQISNNKINLSEMPNCLKINNGFEHCLHVNDIECLNKCLNQESEKNLEQYTATYKRILERLNNIDVLLKYHPEYITKSSEEPILKNNMTVDEIIQTLDLICDNIENNVLNKLVR